MHIANEAREDVARELAYCSFQPGSRFKSGQVARAQEIALELGWLSPSTGDPRLLLITNTGRAALAAMSQTELRMTGQGRSFSATTRQSAGTAPVGRGAAPSFAPVGAAFPQSSFPTKENSHHER